MVKSEVSPALAVGCGRFRALSHCQGIELTKWIILCAFELFFHVVPFAFVAILFVSIPP